MKLGDILSMETEGRPVVGQPVEFWIKKGNGKRFLVKGLFFPVGETERQQSRRDAVKYLRTLPDYQERDGILPPIPERVQREEEQYKFLCAALHDPDEPIAKLVLNQDYPQFRAGVILQQVNWLGDLYEKYVADEYPELIGKQAEQDLEAEARSKS